MNMNVKKESRKHWKWKKRYIDKKNKESMKRLKRNFIRKNFLTTYMNLKKLNKTLIQLNFRWHLIALRNLWLIIGHRQITIQIQELESKQQKSLRQKTHLNLSFTSSLAIIQITYSDLHMLQAICTFCAISWLDSIIFIGQKQHLQQQQWSLCLFGYQHIF